jgi:hypothetical protein
MTDNRQSAVNQAGHHIHMCQSAIERTGGQERRDAEREARRLCLVMVGTHDARGGRDECAVMPQRSLSLHARAEQQECGTYSDCASLEHAGTVWSCSHDPSRQARETLTIRTQNFARHLRTFMTKTMVVVVTSSQQSLEAYAASWLPRGAAVGETTHEKQRLLILKIRVHAVAACGRYREMMRLIHRMVGYRPNVWTAWKLWKPCVLPRHQSTGNMRPRPRCHRGVEAEGFRFRTGDEPES